MKLKIKYLVIAIALVATGGAFVAAQHNDFKLGKSMEILVNMFRDINMLYVDEIDPDKLLKDATEGMTKNLDPYTDYMPAEEMELFNQYTTGKYGGIGSVIRKKGDYIVIAQPYRNSPADKAGLKIGDKILKVDDVDAKGIDAEKISSLLKGDPGTKVYVTVEKLMTGNVETVEVMRERITIPAVPYYGFVNDSIGYIHHSDFSENSADAVKNALTELRKGGKLKGLILDYRSNGGGILKEAVNVVSMFVPKGTEVVSIKGRRPEMDNVFNTDRGPIDTEIPIVVLTNSGSASAAEITAGAMQDLDRAVLMGQRTFGKGLVQATQPLRYNSYLKITIAKYYIPSGRCIQAIDYTHRNEDGSVGIVPDSLIKEFTTKGGRKVYDGGGVMPDIKVEAEYLSPFTIVVFGRGYIEDFVDEYVKRNTTPVDIKKFSLSDQTYSEFVQFMQDKDIEYQSATKTALEDLRKRAERELLLDRIAEDLARIDNNIKDDKNSSLELYRKQLSEIIEDEIVMRYHYSEGVSEYKLAKDELVADAVKLLQDRTRYKTILESQDTSKK